MATLTLPKDSEFNDGQTARGTDVRANDQAIRDFINTAQIDSGNVNLSSNYTWLGIHTFVGGSLRIDGPGTGIATIQYENTSNSRTVTFPDMGTNYDVFPIERAPIGTVVNGRMNLSSGTFSIVGADGNALSASNKMKAVIRDSVGKPITVTFTTGPSFQDDAHAVDTDFVGTGTMSWGTTASTAWSPAMPFLLGICSADDSGTTPIMVLGRGPVLTTGASSNIGYWDNAPSVASQNNVFALTATNVTATHANRPITWVGSFRMVKSAADDWTVQAFDSGDGIGNFYNFGRRKFTMAQGQNGAAASRFMLANGGTTPQWTTMFYEYSISMDTGFCTVGIRFDGDGGTDGAGSVTALVALPCLNPTTSFCYSGNAYVKWAATNEQDIDFNPQTNATNANISRNTSATVRVLMQNADFSAGARTLEASATYPSFL